MTVPPRQPFRVQGPAKGSIGQNTGISTFTITQSKVPTSGNLNILTFTTDNGNCTGIVQTGVTWAKVVGTTPGIAEASEIWAGVIGDGASPTLMISVADAYNAYGRVANVCEYSGLALSNYVDQTATWIGNSSSKSSVLTGTTATTSQAVELVVASACIVNANLTSATNGFTLLDGIQVNAYANAFLEKFLNATGAQSSTVSISPNATYGAGAIATFKAAWPPLTIAEDATVIYQQSSPATPKTSNITATLLKPDGTGYSGKTISFSTSRGSLNYSTVTTDSNGNAAVALTSTAAGIAVVTCAWAGDGTVAAATGYAVVHIFYDAEAGDASQSFQFYIEGKQYAYTTGKYSVNYRQIPTAFQVELPAWDSTIIPNGLVSIYRKGIKEYAGVLRRAEQNLSNGSRVMLSGVDASGLLNDRVIDYEPFNGSSPQSMISALLSRYPCGVTAGTLGNYTASTLTMAVDTVSLTAAVKQICSLVGWVWIVHVDRTLEFEASFGTGLKSVSFVEGGTLLTGTLTLDVTQGFNVIHMRGAGSLRSVAYDAASIAAIGLVEGTAFQATITDQATLDTAAQAALAASQNSNTLIITLEGIDTSSPGTFAPEDQVTVTSPTLGLSGGYQIAQISRDLQNSNYVSLSLEGLNPEAWLLDEQYKRMASDASV